MRRLLPALLALLLSGAPAAATADPIGTATYGRPFCKGTAVHDYQRPLDRLPPVDPPPEQLPFGPHDLNLYPTAMSRVIVGGGGFGYGFFDETYRDRTLRLNWEITGRISRIGGGGRVLKALRQRTARIEETSNEDEIDLWLRMPPGPALYRYDLEFHDLESGALLGSYAEYLRVVQRTFHAGIAVNRESLRSGQVVLARVENRGSEAVAFGLEYDVQRFEGGRWGRSLLGERAWPLVELVMSGGASGSCMRYKIPADAPPGRYRFVKSLGSADGKQGGLRAAEFRVLG